jgi:hypothetical protein
MTLKFTCEFAFAAKEGHAAVNFVTRLVVA